jgi:hypothetical protein
MSERAKFEKYTIAFTIYLLLGCALLAMKLARLGPWAPPKPRNSFEVPQRPDEESPSTRDPVNPGAAPAPRTPPGKL